MDKVDKVWVQESAPETGEGLPLVDAIAKLRDEATSLMMIRHRGHSRELALVLTKLDEARLWAVEYDQQIARRVVVDRQSILREMAEARAREDTTVTTGAGRGLANV